MLAPLPARHMATLSRRASLPHGLGTLQQRPGLPSWGTRPLEPHGLRLDPASPQRETGLHTGAQSHLWKPWQRNTPQPARLTSESQLAGVSDDLDPLTQEGAVAGRQNRQSLTRAAAPLATGHRPQTLKCRRQRTESTGPPGALPYLPAGPWHVCETM